MCRALAGYDPHRAQTIFDWPVREALIAYSALLRAEALVQYRHARLEWAAIKPTNRQGRVKRPPPLPPILRDGDDRG